MEGYPYSYPESGNSSPSRDLDFENPPPSPSPSFDDQPQPLPPNHNLKFLLSYGGKIQPRSHDNQLSYIGGETKILSVNRSITFSSLLSKLSSLLSQDSSSSSPVFVSSFKYQLPGEDLDALISVTNDDDLHHMMLEYDRLYRASTRPVKLRLFAFPAQKSGFGSTCSDPGKVDRECFVGSGPGLDHLGQDRVMGIGNSNVDLLYGMENRGHGPGPVHGVKGQDPGQLGIKPGEVRSFGHTDPMLPPPMVGSDAHIDARIQEMNRLHISSDNLTRAATSQRKPSPTIPTSVQFPASYWQPSPEHHQPPPQPPQQTQNQPMYMFHAPPHMLSGYHEPVCRPVASQQPEGYYQIQRVPSDAAYQEQSVYNMCAPSGPMKVASYPEGMGAPGSLGENTGGYQVVYDIGSGRHVYYAAQGGVGAPFQAEGKVVTKISSSSATL